MLRRGRIRNAPHRLAQPAGRDPARAPGIPRLHHWPLVPLRPRRRLHVFTHASRLRQSALETIGEWDCGNERSNDFGIGRFEWEKTALSIQDWQHAPSRVGKDDREGPAERYLSAKRREVISLLLRIGKGRPAAQQADERAGGHCEDVFARIEKALAGFGQGVLLYRSPNHDGQGYQAQEGVDPQEQGEQRIDGDGCLARCLGHVIPVRLRGLHGPCAGR